MSETVELVGKETVTVLSALGAVDAGYFVVGRNSLDRYFSRKRARQLANRIREEIGYGDTTIATFQLESDKDRRIALDASRCCIEFYLCTPQPEDPANQATLREGLNDLSALCVELDGSLK
jgi:hypothetical protein